MAKKSMVIKANRKPKFEVRAIPAASVAGGPGPIIRDFGMCRICVRQLAARGELPGIRKASW